MLSLVSPQELSADPSSHEGRFAARLRVMRQAAGLTQRQLAALMADRGHDVWTQTTVARTEAGTRPLRLNEYVDLCRLVDQDPSIEFFTIQDTLDDRDLILAELRAQIRTKERDVESAESVAAIRRTELAELQRELEQLSKPAKRRRA